MAKFDIDDELIKRLAVLLDETGLGEIEYSEGDRRLRIARGGTTAVFAPPMTPQAADEPTADSSAGVAAETGEAVIAPMVGTVYISPEPGATPFVRSGDAGDEGQTLLLIEAMKTFNPIRSPRAGRVAKILVGDATPVEFGEALIVLE